LAGTSLRSKHAILAHLFCRLVTRDVRGVLYEPGWEVTRKEVRLCKEVLVRAFREDTSYCETPGKHYCLAWTAVFRSKEGRRLLVFHNIVNRWLNNTDLLAKHSLNWKATDSLILVVDPDQMRKQSASRWLPPVEVYSRLLRVVEENCALRPGQRFPLKVAVVLALPEGHSLESCCPETLSGLSSEAIQEMLLRLDPALLALLRRTVPTQLLGFFGGVVPQDLNLDRTVWLGSILGWVTA